MITLKKFSMDRQDEYYDKINHSSESCNKYTGGEISFSKKQIQAYLERIINDDSRVDFFIMLDDKIIGEVVLNEMDDYNASNIRIAIFDEKHHNKGYGSFAMKKAMAYGFNELNLHRIELSVYDFNHRGIKVYKRLGFVEEGIKRESYKDKNGYHNEITMSILKKEFRG